MKRISLSGTDQYAIVDDEDYPLLSRFKWYVSTNGYAVWRGVKDGRKQTIRLHRLIAQPEKGLVVDHINRNKLDNRRSNLRCVTQAINSRNRDEVENAKGYYLSKSKISNIGKWVVDFRGVCNTFETEEEAKEAVRLIKEGRFVKRKEIVHTYCQKCGDKKECYGSAWVCRRCALKRMKEYYQRKRRKNGKA